MGCSREYNPVYWDPPSTVRFAVEIVCDPWSAVESIGIQTRCVPGHFVFYRFEKFDLKKMLEQKMCRYITKNIDFENRKIAYNCIYIVHFRKIGKSENSEFSKIYNVNAVISDFPIFRIHYFWCCIRTLKDRSSRVLNIFELGKKIRHKWT